MTTTPEPTTPEPTELLRRAVETLEGSQPGNRLRKARETISDENQKLAKLYADTQPVAAEDGTVRVSVSEEEAWKALTESRARMTQVPDPVFSEVDGRELVRADLGETHPVNDPGHHLYAETIAARTKARARAEAMDNAGSTGRHRTGFNPPPESTEDLHGQIHSARLRHAAAVRDGDTSETQQAQRDVLALNARLLTKGLRAQDPMLAPSSQPDAADLALREAAARAAAE